VTNPGNLPADQRAAAAWRWIPSLYFAQGLPYVAVTALSGDVFTTLGVSNAEMTFYTSWLALPWVIKPLWSPLVEFFRTKRLWIVGLQLLMGAGFAAVALAIPAPHFLQLTLAGFGLLAFSSATHDIAADGFYLDALPVHQQAAFVGVRSTFYRVAMIAGQGGLVFLAGTLQHTTGSTPRAWMLVYGLLAAGLVAAGLYHLAVLPRPAADRAVRSGTVGADFLGVFAAFFRKPRIGITLAFLLVYRLAEALALKLVTPFLLNGRAAGGLGLTLEQKGLAYGTIGFIASLLGGLLGGWMISRHGLKRMLWPMIVAMHLPVLAFVGLALTQPASLWIISPALAVEQFGYGFGFTAYLLFMIQVAEGEHKTAHYAICTGFMALGLMLPGMAAGWIQEHLGYVKFFGWVMLATIPSFAAAALVKVDPQFGKKA